MTTDSPLPPLWQQPQTAQLTWLLPRTPPPSPRNVEPVSLGPGPGDETSLESFLGAETQALT